MSATKARQIVLAARPQGKPRLTNFRLEETQIPVPGAGQVLLACIGMLEGHNFGKLIVRVDGDSKLGTKETTR